MSLADAVRANFAAIFYSFFNLVAVICVVTVNKSVLLTLGFSFPITLLAVHCLVTFLGLRIAAAFGVFEMKPLPRRSLAIMAASFTFYNVASLMNLAVSSISSYQLAKIAVAPMCMLLMYIFYSQGTTTNVKLAVAIMLVGVTLATVTDVDVTPTGIFVGLLAVVGAAQSQILIAEMQKNLKASANQLLVAYTPYVFVMLFLLSPLELLLEENSELGFAAYKNWFDQHFSFYALGVILLSGCFGLLVSLSTFLMIGATSALTYNIVGHVKTVSVMVAGVIVFGDSMGSKKLFGIFCALVGVVWYSKIQLDKQAQAKLLPMMTPPVVPAQGDAEKKEGSHA